MKCHFTEPEVEGIDTWQALEFDILEKDTQKISTHIPLFYSAQWYIQIIFLAYYVGGRWTNICA